MKEQEINEGDEEKDDLKPEDGIPIRSRIAMFALTYGIPGVLENMGFRVNPVDEKKAKKAPEKK